MNNKQREEIALFRFGVISELISSRLDPGELTGLIRQQIHDLVVGKKQQPLLVIDEASLLRLDVFAELHTIIQFEGDSKPWLPVVLNPKISEQKEAFFLRIC